MRWKEKQIEVFDFSWWLEYDSATKFDKSNIVWSWNKLFMTISSPLAIIIWFYFTVFENISHAKSVIQVKWGNPQTKLKVAFSQKGLMRSSFLQVDKPDYFPELEFWFLFHSKWLKSCQIRTWSCSNAFFEHSE